MTMLTEVTEYFHKSFGTYKSLTVVTLHIYHYCLWCHKVHKHCSISI